jgi:hypothetical protein
MLGAELEAVALPIAEDLAVLRGRILLMDGSEPRDRLARPLLRSGFER